MTPQEKEEYRRIRKNLTEALEKSGDYAPEVDDLLVDRIATAVIRSMKIRSISDSDMSIRTFTRVVDMETKLAKIVDNATYQLSIGRRDRLADRAQANFVTELKEALLRAIMNADQPNH